MKRDLAVGRGASRSSFVKVKGVGECKTLTVTSLLVIKVRGTRSSTPNPAIFVALRSKSLLLYVRLPLGLVAEVEDDVIRVESSRRPVIRSINYYLCYSYTVNRMAVQRGQLCDIHSSDYTSNTNVTTSRPPLEHQLA